MSSFLFYKSWFLFSENSCLTLTTWKSPFILIFIFHRIFTFPFNFFLFLSYVLCFGGILQDSCCIQCSLLQLSLNQLLCSIRPNINKETASWNTLTFSACKVEVCFPCKVLAYFLFFFSTLKYQYLLQQLLHWISSHFKFIFSSSITHRVLMWIICKERELVT